MKNKSANQQIERRKDRSFSRSRLWVFAIALGVVTGFLLYQAGKEPPRRPGPPPSEAAPSSAVAETKPLSEGDRLPEVALLSLAGQRLQLKAPSGTRPVLIYIFSPTCSICTRTIPTWRALHAVAAARSVEVIGISVLGPTQTAPYVRQHELPWDVYCVGGRDTIRGLGVERVPTTLVIGANGKIAMALRGELAQEQKDAVTAFLTGG